MKVEVTQRRLSRYPIYLKYLKILKENGYESISSPLIAKEMKCSEEQVRKDFQAIASSEGKPKKGRDINEMIHDIESYLGYNDTTEAIIVGAGSLGNAFLNYEGFRKYGLNIIACFDKDPKKVGKIVNGKKIYSIKNMPEFISKNQIEIAIMSVPAVAAQEVADTLMESGVKGILNFVPVHLSVKDNVILENIDMASTLSIVAQKVKEKVPSKN